MVFSSFGNISTVKPPLFLRAKELAKFFLQGSFLYNYFTITGEEKIFFYTKDSILKRFTIEFPLTLRADALRSRKINGPLLTEVSYCHI